MKNYPVLRLLHAAEERADEETTIRDYTSAEELLAAEREPAVIIIDTSRLHEGEERTCYKNILALRQSSVFCYAPLFFTNSLRSLDILADGVSDDITTAVKKGEIILKRGERIKASSLAGSGKLRMLSYMYTRGGDYELKPLCIPGSKWIYGYPEAAVILEHEPGAEEEDGGSEKGFSYNHPVFDADDMERAAKWIRNSQQYGYTEHTKVYDRIRLCPKCMTGHLNYVDLCPNCGSLNIAKKRMLHCFTCGHVAPESEFRHDFSFVCPRCGTKLRHIGSDYDYPLESYQCRDCGSSFVEPEVKVSCLDCGAQSLPEELIVSNFYGYRLSDRGAEAVRTGIISEEFMLFAGTSIVNMRTFCVIMKWLLNLRRRYPDEGFSLLRVKLSGLSEAEEIIGGIELRNLIGELDSRIKSLVRETDITVLGDGGIFWLILPRTPFEGGMILAGRLEALSSLFAGPGAERLSLSVKCFSISEEEAAVSPDELLIKLAKEK